MCGKVLDVLCCVGWNFVKMITLLANSSTYVNFEYKDKASDQEFIYIQGTHRIVRTSAQVQSYWHQVIFSIKLIEIFRPKIVNA